MEQLCTLASNTLCLQKTGLLLFTVCDNFTNSQHLLIISSREGPYSVRNWIR